MHSLSKPLSRRTSSLAIGLLLLGLIGVAGPGQACERHLHGHQGSQTSQDSSSAVQR